MPDPMPDVMVGVRGTRTPVGYPYWRAVCEPCRWQSGPLISKDAAHWALGVHQRQGCPVEDHAPALSEEERTS